MVVSELRGEKIDIIPGTHGALHRQGARPRASAVLVDDESREAMSSPTTSCRSPRQGMNAACRTAHRLEGRHPVRVAVRRAEAEAAYVGGGTERNNGRCLGLSR